MSERHPLRMMRFTDASGRAWIDRRRHERRLTHVVVGLTLIALAAGLGCGALGVWLWRARSR